MSPHEQLDRIKRATVEIISEEELLEKLKENRPLRIKMGFDPTAPDLHLGHSLGLNKMKLFQELGHDVIFVVGDFTARIGDPTGKNKTRPPLSREEILENAKTYQEQVFKILDPQKTRIVFNSEWCDKLAAQDMIQLAAQMNVARMLEREDFKNRYTSGQSISIHEFLYPLMQGYDSVELKADVELGGQDQRFNLLVGRDLQKNSGQPQQCLILLPLLEGTDGQDKMSKSLGNAIGIQEDPREIFGKIMSIPDELMPRYYELLTTIEKSDYESRIAKHPRDAKLDLGCLIVEKYYDADSAEAERQRFLDQFSKKKFDASMAEELVVKPEDLELPLFKAMANWQIASSGGEARRSLQQGACKMIFDSEEIKLTENSKVSELKNGYFLKVGKRKLYKIHK